MLNLLYKKFIELDGTPINIPEKWEQEYRIFFQEQYQIYGNGAKGFVKRKFLKNKIQTEYKEEWKLFVETVRQKYEIEGIGLKLLAKEIGISYTKTRRLLEYNMHINIRSGRDVITENLKRVRRENAIKSGGWRFKKVKNKNTERGVQGFYFNKPKNKYVWLRSAYEFIMAKWLNDNKIIWDIECQSWTLNNGETYTPDFFIYDENNLMKKIIEVKGFYKNRLWKFDELKKDSRLTDIEFCLIDNIEPFLCGSTYLGELKWWKKNRLLELKS